PPHPVLPSFPTRRSSDLTRGGRGEIVQRREQRAVLDLVAQLALELRVDRGRKAVRDGVADDDVTIHRRKNQIGKSRGRSARHHNSRRARPASYLIVWRLVLAAPRRLLYDGAKPDIWHHLSASAAVLDRLPSAFQSLT